MKRTWLEEAQEQFLRQLEAGTDPKACEVCVPPGAEANRVGAAVRALSERGAIVAAGYVRSAKPSRKGGAQRAWLAGEDSAVAAALLELRRKGPQLELDDWGGDSDG